MNNPSGDEENTYHVQNVSDSSGSNNSDNNIRDQLNTYDTYNNFNRFHEANIEVRQFDDIYVDDSNDDTNYSPKGEGYVDNNRGNAFDGPRSYRYVRPVNENELEFVIDDFIDRVKEGESFMSPWRQTPSCVFRLLFLRKRKHLRNGFETYFSAFIETIRKDDWVSDWGFYDVQYYIILFNLIDYRRSFYKADHFSFNHLNTDRGWHEFIDADQLSEPGFIHKDGHVVLRAGMYPYGSENYKNTKEGNYNSKLRTGFVGLKNHGATCYMNALLQLLYHINIFRNAVCMMVFNIEKTIGKQTLEFYKKKLIKKKKKKKALLQKERALERERALQHLERLKKEGAVINSIGEGKTGVEVEAKLDMCPGIGEMGVKNEIGAAIKPAGSGMENGNVEDILRNSRAEIGSENKVEVKSEHRGEDINGNRAEVQIEKKMDVEIRNKLEIGMEKKVGQEDENEVEMTNEGKAEIESLNTVRNEERQSQQMQKEHERKEKKGNEVEHMDERTLKTGNEHGSLTEEQVALNTEDNREKTETVGNLYKTDSILLKLAESVENVDGMTHNNLSSVSFTRGEHAVTDDNIKDPFVDCESSSDPSIGTSGNGMHIFGNLDESLVLDRDVKNGLPGEVAGGMIDLQPRVFSNDANQEREEGFAMQQKEMLSKRMKELEIDADVERNANLFSGHSEGAKDVNNFVSPLLNDRSEPDNLFHAINNNNINDMTARDTSQLKGYDSDDLEMYSWDTSLSDSNLSVLSFSSSGSSSYKTCSSSASCYYKKKKNKNKFLKSKEINYRNILLEEEAERKNAPAVSLALQNLFYKLHTMKEAVSCKELIRSFGWDASDVFTQQDTHELLKLLLDKVEEQMKGTVVEGYVKKLFEGEVETYIECIDIEYKSLRKETYEDIQLDVQGCNNIYESLDKAIEAEILEGDNIYETDGFGKQRAKKGMRFLSFPNICIFLLKRFTFDLQKMETVKLNNHFEFYKELDLSKYCPGGGEYVLQAVSVHQGSMNSGHYYSFSYKHDEKVWIKCDDEKIFRVSEYSVINDNFGGYDIVLDEDLYDFNIKERLKQRVKHYSAYMLVYVKKSLIPNLIKECNPAMVNPQVVRRCKLEEIINRKRMELRQKILQHIKVKVYDKYSYMYKSFRDLPVDGIPALFNMKFDRNTSIWEVYRKIITAIEKIYDRKKKKRNTKMCKQTNKKQKTLQMLDHCMNAEITQPKRDIDDCLEVAEKRTKITHVTENNIVQPTTSLIFGPNNSNCIINVDGKEHENGTEFLSAQEERNEAADSSGIDPGLVYFTHQQFTGNKAEMGVSSQERNLVNETNEGNDAYKIMQQKRKMETWNDTHNHRSSGSDSGKGVKTAKTGKDENERDIWGNWNNMQMDMKEEILHLNEEETKHADDERGKPVEENDEHVKPRANTRGVKTPTTPKEEVVHEHKPINEVTEEKENQYGLYSNVNDNVKLIEQNLNDIKINKSMHEEDSENEEMILPSFDSDSLSSSQSCLTVVGNNANLFTVKRKPKKKKKIRRRGRLSSAYAKRMRNRSNSSSSNMAYNSSDSMESDDSDSSSGDSSSLHLTAFHLQPHQCVPRHRRPFPSALSDSSSNSVSGCSVVSSDDDSSKVSEFRGGLKENDDQDNSNNSSNRQSGKNNGGKGNDSDSACSDFTRATRSFFLLVSNRDVYRYLSIPLKKYGNYKLWELHDKTNKESNDLFPTLEILYLPYYRKTRVAHPSKKGENRLIFFKYFDIFKHERINDASLICLDILNCSEHIKPRQLEKRALEKIVKAMEKGYVTKYSYDFLVQYVKNGRTLSVYPLRFKIFVEYNNYRHLLKLDKSLLSNKVIAGDILVFNFLCNDIMEEAKINTFKEGKARDDFDFTHEHQTRYSARSNSNMNLKILYKKVKLVTHMNRWGNCSYLVNNRDGTHYRVRVLTDQEEMELAQKQAKEMELRERKMREHMLKENDVAKDMGESNDRNKEKDERGYENIEGGEIKKVAQGENIVNGNLQRVEKQGKDIIGDLNNDELSRSKVYDMCGKVIEAMSTNGMAITNHVKENGVRNKDGVTVMVDHITNDDMKVHMNVHKIEKEKDSGGEDLGNEKNSTTFNYGRSQSSCSRMSFRSSSNEQDWHQNIPQKINGEEEVEKSKHEYVIRKDEQSSLRTLSELLNFDELNNLLNANYSVGDKDIKALYVYLEKNKNKYGHGYGRQHTYVFSLVDKDSHEIVKLLNACINKFIQNTVEAEEYGIDKNIFLCRDHQYPFYSPSSSDIVIEKDRNVNMHRKRKRVRMGKEAKLKRGRVLGKKATKGKKTKKTKSKKGESSQEAEHFCEFMNYQHEPSNVCIGKVTLNHVKEEGSENRKEQEGNAVKRNRRKLKSTVGEKGEHNESDEEADEEKKKEKKKNKDRREEKTPNDEYEKMTNDTTVKEKITEMQDEEKENGKKEEEEEEEEEEDEDEEEDEEKEDKMKKESGEEGTTEKNNERDGKYVQGCMCASASEISYCSSARSSLTFTSETSDYYLEDFKEDCLELGHSFKIYDHKKKQKELKKVMKQKMKRKKTSRSREGKNGGSGDTSKVIVERNRIISESSEGREGAMRVGGVGAGAGTGIATGTSMYASHKENEIIEPSITNNNNTLQNESYSVLNPTNYIPNNGSILFQFNCETTKASISNEEMAEKHINKEGLEVRCGESYHGKLDNTQMDVWKKEKADVKPLVDLKENTIANDMRNAVVRTGEKQMTHFFSVGESDDGSNDDNKMGAFPLRKGNEERDASLSSTRPFVEEKEKKKKKKKIVKKVGGVQSDTEPTLPFYVICDFYDFVERKMHLYKFRFKAYDPIYQLGKYRNCVGMCLKRKIKKKTLNYIDSFYKFYKREIDKIDLEIDVRGPTKRIFQHVCHKLNVDPARVLVYPFPPMLAPINYTPYNIDSVSCLVDVETEKNMKSNRNLLEPTCFHYFYNKLTAINDPFVMMEERTCYMLLLPLHYKYVFRSYMKRCTRHLFYIIQLFNSHVQTVAAFCGHIAYRTSRSLNGKYVTLNDCVDIIGNFDLSDEDSDDGRSIYADRPSLSEFSTVQDLINKIKLEMNPYLKKRGVDPKQKFRLSYIADTRIRYLKNEEPLICVDFFKNRTVTSMFVNPLRMEPDYTDMEKQLLMRGNLKIIQVFHNAPIKAWVGFGFGFEVLVKPTDNMSEIKNRIRKKTLLPRCVFDKLSFFELEDDQRLWKSNDDVINWDKKEIAILIADHNSPSNSRNQKGMKIA